MAGPVIRHTPLDLSKYPALIKMDPKNRATPRTKGCNTDQFVMASAELVYSDRLRAAGLAPRVVIVRVSLDGSGKPVGTRILSSSGYPEVDDAAIHAAQESKFAPRRIGCRGVPSAIDFRASFDPSQ